jgi:anaphase-promoting complex subunit 3
MDYKKAKQTFQALRKRAPSWIDDLEVYSTVLWHLKDEVPLSLLAHELTESHFQSPETWCAVGNSFSVCRSRDEAIRCFRRACQLSPQLPQAYSLLGYELMEQEDYYEAIGAFQRAIRVEPRFYTAWVGLGRAYERLSRNDVALKHYLTAVEINSSNPIIYTYVARVCYIAPPANLGFSNNAVQVLETLQKRRSAIEYLRRGIRLSPPPLTMALIRMQRAGIYLYAGQPGAALEDLRAVALIAPDEPRVHLLLGQAYAMQGEDKAAALKSYTTALSLAPWVSSYPLFHQDLVQTTNSTQSREIKDAMLSLEDE